MENEEDSGGFSSSASKRSKVEDESNSGDKSFDGTNGVKQGVEPMGNNTNPMLCDVVLRILFDFCGARELKTARRVCKKWKLYSTKPFLEKSACKFESHELLSRYQNKCARESSTCRWEKFSQYVLSRPKGTIPYKNFVFCLHSIRLKSLEPVLNHCSSNIENIVVHSTTISITEFYNFLKLLPNLRTVGLFNIDISNRNRNNDHEEDNNRVINHHHHHHLGELVDDESDEDDDDEEENDSADEESNDEEDEVDENEGVQINHNNGLGHDHHHHHHGIINIYEDQNVDELSTTHIPINFNTHLTSLTLGNWTIPSSIFIKWNMLLLGFPNIEELLLENISRVEIEKCLVNIIAVETLEKGKLKIKKLGLIERKEISGNLIAHRYENFVNLVCKVTQHLPLQHLSLETKASAWGVRKIIENCHLTLKSLTLCRPPAVECSLEHNMSDSVFHNKLYPNLTTLAISNIYIGSLDDVRLNCPKLHSLCIYFNRNHFCRPEQVARYLISPNTRIPEEYIQFTTLRRDVITSLPNASPNNTVKILKWISCDNAHCDTIFSDSVNHLHRIFPCLTSLSASFNNRQDFETVFRYFLNLEELRVQRKSLCKTENEIILGKLPHLLQNIDNEKKGHQSIANTQLIDNRNIYGPVSYFGLRNLQNLKWLYLDNDNSLLTDSSVVNGFLKLQNLQFLLINNPRKISAKRLLALTESQKLRFQSFIY